MRKIILTLFCILISLIGFCQTCEQIIKSAKKIAFQDKNYELAIKKLGAIFIAKDCGQDKVNETNYLINQIYSEVNNQRILADSKTKEAIKEANRAKALYWASESAKLVPNQAIQLLRKALNMSSQKKVIKDLMVDYFNKVFPKNNFIIFKFKPFIKMGTYDKWKIPDPKYLPYIQNKKLFFYEKHNILSSVDLTNRIKYISVNLTNRIKYISKKPVRYQTPDHQVDSTESDKYKLLLRELNYKFDDNDIYFADIKNPYKTLFLNRKERKLYLLNSNLKDISFLGSEVDDVTVLSKRWIVVSIGLSQKLLCMDRPTPEYIKNKEVSNISISEDSNYLLLSNLDDEFEVWDMSILDNYIDSHLMIDDGEILSVKISKDKQWLVISNDSFIGENYFSKIYSIKEEKIPDSLSKEIILSNVKFSNNCKKVLTKNMKGDFKLWNISDWSSKLLFINKNIENAFFSSDNNFVIGKNLENNEIIYNIETEGEQLPNSINIPIDSNSYLVENKYKNISNDNLFNAVLKKNRIEIFDYKSGTLLSTHWFNYPISQSFFEGNFLYLVCNRELIRVNNQKKVPSLIPLFSIPIVQNSIITI